MTAVNSLKAIGFKLLEKAASVKEKFVALSQVERKIVLEAFQSIKEEAYKQPTLASRDVIAIHEKLGLKEQSLLGNTCPSRMDTIRAYIFEIGARIAKILFNKDIITTQDLITTLEEIRNNPVVQKTQLTLELKALETSLHSLKAMDSAVYHSYQQKKEALSAKIGELDSLIEKEKNELVYINSQLAQISDDLGEVRQSIADSKISERISSKTSVREKTEALQKESSYIQKEITENKEALELGRFNIEEYRHYKGYYQSILQLLEGNASKERIQNAMSEVDSHALADLKGYEKDKDRYSIVQALASGLINIPENKELKQPAKRSKLASKLSGEMDAKEKSDIIKELKITLEAIERSEKETSLSLIEGSNRGERLEAELRSVSEKIIILSSVSLFHVERDEDDDFVHIEDHGPALPKHLSIEGYESHIDEGVSVSELKDRERMLELMRDDFMARKATLEKRYDVIASFSDLPVFDIADEDIWDIFGTQFHTLNATTGDLITF